MSRYLINRSIEKNGAIHAAIVQSLTVVSQYESLLVRKAPLFQEPIVYKKLGARVEGLTREYSTTLFEPITFHRELRFKDEPFEISVVDIPFDENMFSEDEQEIMNQTAERYLDLSYVLLKSVIDNYATAVHRLEFDLGIKLNYLETRE